MTYTDNDRGIGGRASELLRTFKRAFDSTEIVERAVNDFFDYGDFDAPWEIKLKTEEIEKFRATFRARLNEFSVLYDDAEAFELVALPILFQWRDVVFYHHKSADFKRSAFEAAESVAAGRGFLRGGKLGGNPFFDVVLANACQARQERGTRFFNAEHDEAIRAAAAAWTASVGRDPRLLKEAAFDEQCLLDFKTEFFYNGPLSKYRGWAGLSAYWRRPLQRFLLRRWTEKTLDDELTGVLQCNARTVASDDAGAAELRTAVLDSCVVAEDKMNDGERRVMHCRIGKGMRNNEVAVECRAAEYKTSNWYASGSLKLKSALVAGREDEQAREVVKYLASTRGCDLGDYWLNKAKIVEELRRSAERDSVFNI